MPRLISFALVALALVGCGAESVDDAVASLQSTFDAGDYEAVIEQAPALADRAGTDGASASVVWRVHKLHIQALAKEGRGSDAVAAMAALGADHADKLDAQLYQMLSGYVADAGEPVEAVAVLEQALERMPDKKSFFDPQIQQLASQSDEAAEKLRSLGYL